MSSLEFAKLVLAHVDWMEVSSECDNSEELEQFIRANECYVDWCAISYGARLSESFIREYQHKVDWAGISLNRDISEEFAEEFKEFIHEENFMRNGMRKRKADK
ncbi:hypothetical protein JG687_00016782 [Phytophthora cactorum]|uniref:Uncharacterized protein n=1 Tax=Phytophthora cactorum TaxID=29920 RepID=A0A329RRR9_9STRA|nr:hypothetical protein Pcac1_g28556 [Phytophthora cactorum]KAG2809456.1 hypothetical protein PC112_g16501 [Phytophthora cactorum]KAG2811096.1 hypothetical protein PC111_g15380 [Phytophthora cactorum]KAG2850743.1 hypothetical protein PC113_g16503 [Phytophthora cactorum]KAG2889308.1 hypothetical protein PC114_g18018 [Phytophthora cactorum]